MRRMVKRAIALNFRDYADRFHNDEIFQRQQIDAGRSADYIPEWIYWQFEQEDEAAREGAPYADGKSKGKGLDRRRSDAAKGKGRKGGGKGHGRP